MLAEKLRMGFAVAGLVPHFAWEKIARPRCVTAEDVPASVDDLTVEWLTDVLCGKVPGAKVLRFTITGGSNGTSSRRAITVEYNEAGRHAGLPERLYTKATPRFTSRLVAGPTGKIAKETGFYNDIRPLLDIEAPRAVYARYHPASIRSMILFEDLTATRGCRFIDPDTHVDRAMAEGMIELMARYHGAMWEHPRLAAVMTTHAYQTRINATMGFADRSLIGVKRAAAKLPRELLAIPYERLWRTHMRSLELGSRAPMTLQHWDMHIGNWYATPEGRMGLADWGMVKGCWAGDYIYALLSALTIEDRRAWERDLLCLYLDRLAAHGGKPPDFDTAWLMIRQQTLHPLFYWLVTIGAGPLQPDMQPDRISLINLERMGQGLIDLDGIASVEA